MRHLLSRSRSAIAFARNPGSYDRTVAQDAGAAPPWPPKRWTIRAFRGRVSKTPFYPRARGVDVLNDRAINRNKGSAGQRAGFSIRVAPYVDFATAFTKSNNRLRPRDRKSCSRPSRTPGSHDGQAGQLLDQLSVSALFS